MTTHDVRMQDGSQQSTLSQPIRGWQSELRAPDDVDYDELIEPVRFRFAIDRRSFVQVLGAGVLVTAIGAPAVGQRGGGGGGRRRGGFFGGPPAALSARFHFADDGMITVFSGKVDAGQGARCELAQAAAEELRVPCARVRAMLADTAACPNDGITAGSGTTPRTVPAIRQAAAAVRQLFVASVARKWQLEPGAVEVRDGKLFDPVTKRSQTYVAAANDEELAKVLDQPAAGHVELTRSSNWKVLGSEQKPPAARDKVLGRHAYPSDMRREGMLYGAVLRSPQYRAKLRTVKVPPAEQLFGATAVVDGDFVGVFAPTAFAARQAIEAMGKAAHWAEAKLPSSAELYDYLRANVPGGEPTDPFEKEFAAAKKRLKATYTIPYVQHAPLEPRVALAEWADGKLTVWTATQNPFGVRGELAEAFHLADDKVRVIVLDFGSGYGGKHTGECAVEAARLAQAAKRPVMLRWTREEEFTNAYFRPAAVIDVAATLDDAGRLATYYQLNINAGRNSVESPYNAAKKRSSSVESRPPLRHGSYRALAATGNTFARESFMDELAEAAGADPLEFRRSHLTDARLRAVLEEAATQFGWAERVRKKQPGRGVGLACGTEKGSFVACCAEVEIDKLSNAIRVLEVSEAFDCGAVLNPENLRNQIEGAITMGLGPALHEEIRIENSAIATNSFRSYRVPRFADAPQISTRLVNRPAMESAGAGETPIIAIAPAIGNAVFRATGQRLRRLPMRLA